LRSFLLGIPPTAFNFVSCHLLQDDSVYACISPTERPKVG